MFEVDSCLALAIPGDDVGEVLDMAEKFDLIADTGVGDSIVKGHAVEHLQDKVFIEKDFGAVNYLGALLTDSDGVSIAIHDAVVHFLTASKQLSPFHQIHLRDQELQLVLVVVGQLQL